MVDTYRQTCKSLTHSAAFKLENEDPEVYASEDRMGFNPPRAWPKKQIPKATAQTSAAPAVSPTSIKKALSVHHMTVDWLKSIGVEACKEYANQSVELILEGVQAKETICKVCSKDCYDTQRLRAHIRAKHMSVTPYHCKKCNQYFADQATLTLHNRKHSLTCQLFECDQCEKTYTSQSRLTEHKKVHNPLFQNQPCKFGCGKKFNEKKNRVHHEEYCENNPNRPPRVQCPYCPKDFARAKDLFKHSKKHHPGRDVQADMVQ